MVNVGLGSGLERAECNPAAQASVLYGDSQTRVCVCVCVCVCDSVCCNESIDHNHNILRESKREREMDEWQGTDTQTR